MGWKKKYIAGFTAGFISLKYSVQKLPLRYRHGWAKQKNYKNTVIVILI